MSEVARDWGVSRRTMHRWLARYEADGLEGLNNRSHRPAHSPHQMPAVWRRWCSRCAGQSLLGSTPNRLRAGPQGGAEPPPSESAVYRCLVRAAVIDPQPRRAPGDLETLGARCADGALAAGPVHGFLLADGTTAKALTGVDDHSRYCVSARLMARERTQSVCDGFSSALRTYGVPAQVLTDNGKVFTGRFAQPPVEVLFDRICRENGVDHLLTEPRSPTTTGKIERFHKTLRVEFDTRQVFRNLKTAQEALDEWVSYYNTQRPHQSLADATPESRFHAGDDQPQHRLTPRPERNGEQWVCRRVASNGLVSVGYQQVSVGKHFGGSACDVLVTDGLLQFWVGNELLKTVVRTSKGNVRKLHADGTAGRR